MLVQRWRTMSTVDTVGHHQSTDASPEREAVIGTLLCTASVGDLPARPWPLVAACQTLANALPGNSRHRSVIAPALSSLDGWRVVETWLRALGASGAFHVAGRANLAKWVAEPKWLDGWRPMLQLMDADERIAWEAAGQVLRTTWARWRKAASAA
jgi:hypothetical protein